MSVVHKDFVQINYNTILMSLKLFLTHYREHLYIKQDFLFIFP